MAKAVLLHIGTAKTGTTALQEALIRGRASGHLSGTAYPTVKGHHEHGWLPNVYLSDDRLTRSARPHFLADEASFKARQQRNHATLFSKLRKADAAVLSTDNFSLLSADEAQRLRDDLEGAGFGDFLVVLYVRDPADYYLSHSQQRLKASSRLSDPVSFRYHFRDVIETWERVFPGRLVVREYVSGSTFDAVRDFSGLMHEYLGLSLAPLPTRVNTTISAEGMVILQSYRRAFGGDHENVFTPDADRLVAFLQDSVSVIPQTKPSLKPEIAAVIRRNHRADADFLKSRYGVDLGLSDDAASLELRHGPTRSVADVLERCDPETVIRLLLHIAKPGLDREPSKRPLSDRITARLTKILGDEPTPR